MDLQDGDAARRWKPGPRAWAVARGLIDLLAPPRELDGELHALSTGLSAGAWSRISFIEAPACDGCGAPFEFDLGEKARCAGCMARPRAFSRARAACVYDEASRDPILKLKHADRLDLAPMFARWISRAAHDLLDDCDAVAPVPLHPLRLLRRRCNQAAEIARPLATMAGVDYLPDALVRRRATDAQGGKSAGARRRNVAAAFAVPERRAQRVAGRRILLIDDVLTTGATAEGCARALLAAGAAGVDLAVVARVPEIDSGAI